MRRLLVRTLLALCEAQDFLRLDYVTRRRHTLAYWSARLDERWHTGVWKPYAVGNHEATDYWEDEPVADVMREFDQVPDRGVTGRD